MLLPVSLTIVNGLVCDTVQLMQGRWNDTTEEWVSACDWSHDSFDVFLSTSARKRVVLLGDSNMLRSFNSLISLIGTCVVVKRASRCNVIEYMNLQRADAWLAPNSTIEGPALFGLANPWCNDCSGCDTQMWKCGANRQHVFEYVSMEFYNDVEIQTRRSRTTQQAIFTEYLAQDGQTDLVLIVSVGLHDIILPSFLPTLPAPFHAVLTFLETLHVPTFLLTTTHIDDSSVPVDYRSMTNNNNSNIVRHALLDQVKTMRQSAPWLHAVDAYQMSLGEGLQDPRSLHSDHVHLSGKNSIFYRELCRVLMASLLALPQVISTRT